MTLPSKNPAHSTDEDKRSLGKGVFRKCDECGAVHTAEAMADSWEVCGSCGHHHPLAAARWRALLLDDGRLERWGDDVRPMDPLSFDDGKRYVDRLRVATSKTGASDAIEVGRAQLDGTPIGYGAFLFSFMGGSMGSVVGERITRLFEQSLEARLPVVLLHASGGARMQEGILSLMQMAKTVGALARLRDAGLPYISVSLHPTTGGVAASTALLGDINLTEPNAQIGFAGPRVIESTLRTTLPAGFQRAEFLLDHGMVDRIVPRLELRGTLRTLLHHLTAGAARARSGTAMAASSAATGLTEGRLAT